MIPGEEINKAVRILADFLQDAYDGAPPPLYRESIEEAEDALTVLKRATANQEELAAYRAALSPHLTGKVI